MLYSYQLNNKHLMDKLLSSHDIISFDMFDTLISRPFARPEDLQEYAGGLKYKQDRQSGVIPKPSARELELELELCRPIPKIQTIFNKALALNKQIIVISDMYLPSSFLHTMLTKCGYHIFKDKIFVSCEHNCSKSNTLFSHVQSLFPDKSILHFDDADYAIAKATSYGITAIKVRKVLWDLYDRYPRLKFLPQNNLSLRYYLGWLAQQPIHSNYFKQMGFMLGVIGYGFAQFVNTQAHALNIQTLLFLSRDMYVIHKFYNRLKNVKDNHYVFHSRRISRNGKNYDWYYNNYKSGKTALVDTTSTTYTAQGTIRADAQIYEMVGDTLRNPTKNIEPITWAGTYKNSLRPNPFLELLWTEPVESVIDLIQLDEDTIKIVRGTEDKRDNTKIKEMVEGQLEFEPLPNIFFSFQDCKDVFRNFIDGLTTKELEYIDQLAIYQDDHHSIRRESVEPNLIGI